MIKLVDRLKVSSENDLRIYEALYVAANHLFEQDFSEYVKYNRNKDFYYMEASLQDIYYYAKSLGDKERIAKVIEKGISVCQLKQDRYMKDFVKNMRDTLRNSTVVDYAEVYDAGFNIYLSASHLPQSGEELYFALAPKNMVEYWSWELKS